MANTRIYLHGGHRSGDMVIVTEPLPRKITVRYVLPAKWRFVNEPGWENRQFVSLEYERIGSTVDYRWIEE